MNQNHTQPVQPIQQKQIQKQRIKNRKQIEKGKNVALSQTSKLWSIAYKECKQQEAIQKAQRKEIANRQNNNIKIQIQRHTNRNKNNANKDKAIMYVKILFPETRINTITRPKKLPPCVRVVGKPKPASMKYPNLEAIRQKPKTKTKTKTKTKPKPKTKKS